MKQISVKHFSSPDEDRPFAAKGHIEVVKFDEAAVGRAVFEPGWKWSEHVKPIAGTDSCQAAHACYVISGRMRVRTDDGQEAEVGPGDCFFVDPGHDAWTLGDEPCVMVDFSGAQDYAKKRYPAQPYAQEPIVAH